MTFTVLRSGKTAKVWSPEAREVSVSGGILPKPYRAWPEEVGLQLQFRLSSAGGGTTEVLVAVLPDSFMQVASAMLEADPDAAIKAFGEALSGLPERKT